MYIIKEAMENKGFTKTDEEVTAEVRVKEQVFWCYNYEEHKQTGRGMGEPGLEGRIMTRYTAGKGGTKDHLWKNNEQKKNRCIE